MGIEDMKAHRDQAHSSEDHFTFFREFDWVHLKVGDGHYEMNLMKSFMELNWDVCMTDLVQLMGWKSEIAINCAKKCTDNHKSWQLFMTFFFGTLQQLVLPYVRDCLLCNESPTP